MLRSTYLTLALRHDLLVDTPLRWIQGIYENSHSPTCDQIAICVKQDISSSWRQAPIYEWYEGNRPGAALIGTSSWQDETILARLGSGLTQAQSHVAGFEVYPLF
ncbi:hypothetical protein TNCV_463001 [Trichonephila clavipes]|nr:hypothetical protein TNCV_463001 [Trichonephila clavipes]